MRALILPRGADAATAAEAGLTDDQLIGLYAPPAGGSDHGDGLWVRFNFVAAADGAATLDGLTGGLGTPADQRLFALLRRPADVILVGAGTVRAEGYEGSLLSASDAAWRRDRGLPAHPDVAVVSGSLELDPGGEFFRQAPVRPLVLTTSSANARWRAALEEVADVVECGEGVADPARIRAVLAARGHRLVHSEGGPTVFGSFASAGVADELCLSLSPLLTGRVARRIIDGPDLPEPVDLTLLGLLEEDGALFLRYRVGAA